MLAKTVMFGACTEFSVLENTGLPTHKPLSVLLSLDAFTRRALRPRRPLAFPALAGSAEPPVPEDLWRPVSQAWTAALTRRGEPDLDTMWTLFCQATEAYLLAVHNDHLDRPPQRYLGRASCRPPRLSPVVAPQCRGDQCGALTNRHLRLLKLLRHVDAHTNARTSAPLGPLPYLEIARWRTISREKHHQEKPQDKIIKCETMQKIQE